MSALNKKIINVSSSRALSHPWGDMFPTFSAMHLLTFVVKIDDLTLATKRLILAESLVLDPVNITRVKTALGQILDAVMVVEATPDFISILSEKTLLGANQFLRQQINSTSVLRGLNILKSIIVGSLGNSDNASASRWVLKQHVKEPVGGSMFVLLSAQYEAEPSQPFSLINGDDNDSMMDYFISESRKDALEVANSTAMNMAAALQEAERLSALGKLAAHIIHEINNPITVICGKAEKIQRTLASMDIPNFSGAKELADSSAKIIAMTDRINRIIRSMKNMARNSATEDRTKVKIAELMAEVYELIDIVTTKLGVELTMNKPTSELKAVVQRLRISQVLVNLINNACEAVAPLKERWIRIDTHVEDEWIYLSITDSGLGLSANVKSRLFENYFTTKPVGLGTGIGLSLSRQIIREHGGDLYLDEDSTNTKFVVKLPLAPESIQENWEEI